jgi:phosphoribosylformylglycinamidine synthase
VLLGQDRLELGGSAYLRLLHGIEQGAPPAVDLEAEARLAELLRMLVWEGWAHAAHDLSEGGLAVALAEACFFAGLGARLRLEGDPLSLFSESQARAVVAVSAAQVDSVLAMAEEMEVPARDIGEVGGDRLELTLGDQRMGALVEDLRRGWMEALPRVMEHAS